MRLGRPIGIRYLGTPKSVKRLEKPLTIATFEHSRKAYRIGTEPNIADHLYYLTIYGAFRFPRIITAARSVDMSDSLSHMQQS